MSGTESIFASAKALAADPYVEDKGITEDDIPDILLSQSKTAREAVALLGHIVETVGAGEGFGVAVVDDNEIWYWKPAAVTSGWRSACQITSILPPVIRAAYRITTLKTRT